MTGTGGLGMTAGAVIPSGLVRRSLARRRSRGISARSRGGGTSDFDSGATRLRRLHRFLFSCFVPPSSNHCPPPSVLRPPPSPLISVLRHLSSVLRPPSPSCVPVISCFPALSHRLPSSVFRPPSSVLRLPPSPPSCVPVISCFPALSPLSSVLCSLSSGPCPLACSCNRKCNRK